MQKKSLIILFFVLTYFFIGKVFAQQNKNLVIPNGSNIVWKEAMYQEYDYETFAQSAFANKEIDINNIDYACLNAAIFYATNEQRKKHHLPAFQHLKVLEESAWAHSQDMVNYGFFSHVSPVSGKKLFSDRINFKYSAAAENIAQNHVLNYKAGTSYSCPTKEKPYFTDSQGKKIPTHSYRSYGARIVEQWMNSNGHRKNILNNTYIYLGCGAAIEKNDKACNFERVFSTQNFAK